MKEQTKGAEGKFDWSMVCAFVGGSVGWVLAFYSNGVPGKELAHIAITFGTAFFLGRFVTLSVNTPNEN